MAHQIPESPRKQPQQSRAQVTVDAIVLAAAHILKTQGFEKANTNAIAKLAGVSIGSLYQYFPNKQAIVAALRERHKEWFDECLTAEVERIQQLPLREAIRGVVEILVALHVVDPALHNALAAEARPVHEDAERGFRVLMQRFLEAHAHEVRELNTELASFIVLRALEAVIHTTALDEPERMREPEFSAEVAELAYRYLRK